MLMRLPVLVSSLAFILHAAVAGAITFGSDLAGAADNTGT